MQNLAVVFLLVTTVLAQDLVSTLLGTYGSDINTNMIHKNSGEMETGGVNTDYSHPIPAKHHLMRRQAPYPLHVESCTRRGLAGRCMHFELCPEVLQDKYMLFTSLHTCENYFEICCPYPTSTS